ncbi:DUF6232 family protein [Microcoleus sp. B5-D4]|uniref:DUF6232 family protein n=1 Tax=unclassified Microcoleus TaxID=2642155 RepID=UPI002FD39202
MSTSNPLASNQNITLERNKVITITKRTVRFSNDVYQTHNITGFSEGEVEIGTIPWGIIVALLLMGSIAGVANSGIGVALSLAAIGGAVWNFVKPKHYGLLLTFNSGHQTLFVTDDKPHLKEKINTIYELIEKAENKTYELSILNSTVSGQFIMGTDNRM